MVYDHLLFTCGKQEKQIVLEIKKGNTDRSVVPWEEREEALVSVPRPLPPRFSHQQESLLTGEWRVQNYFHNLRFFGFTRIKGIMCA